MKVFDQYGFFLSFHALFLQKLLQMEEWRIFVWLHVDDATRLHYKESNT